MCTKRVFELRQNRGSIRRFWGLGNTRTLDDWTKIAENLDFEREKVDYIEKSWTVKWTIIFFFVNPGPKKKINRTTWTLWTNWTTWTKKGKFFVVLIFDMDGKMRNIFRPAFITRTEIKSRVNYKNHS